MSISKYERKKVLQHPDSGYVFFRADRHIGGGGKS